MVVCKILINNTIIKGGLFRGKPIKPLLWVIDLGELIYLIPVIGVIYQIEPVPSNRDRFYHFSDLFGKHGSPCDYLGDIDLFFSKQGLVLLSGFLFFGRVFGLPVLANIGEIFEQGVIEPEKINQVVAKGDVGFLGDNEQA